jgi:hypothetical protein
MITFKSNTTLPDVEKCYVDIHTDKSDVIRIPGHLDRGGAFGVHSSLIQFISNWSRINKTGKLMAYSSLVGEKAFENFIKRPVGLIGAFTAPMLIDKDRNHLDRNKVLTFATPTIDAMQKGKYVSTFKGLGVFLTCLSGAKNEFLRPLYSRPVIGAIRGIEGFSDLAKNILNTCVPNYSETIRETDFNSIALLIRELFENTDDHATTDEYGRKYTWASPCSRSILARRITVDSTNDNTFTRDMPHAIFVMNTQLIKGKSLHANSKTKKYEFIELSIVDTGLGIARRWFEKAEMEGSVEDLSIEKELGIVKGAFEFGASTKPLKGTGHGLTNALNSLKNLNAFLQIRTGRLCLYQDFSSKRDNSTQGKRGNIFDPKHWTESQPKCAPTVGTSYSIIIPLPYQERK